MSVLPMKRISVIGLRKDRKAILETIQRSQAVEIDMAPMSGADGDIFKKIDVSSSSQIFTKNAESAAKALEIVNTAAPEKTSLLSSFEGRKEISMEDFASNVSRREAVMKDVQDILRLEKELIQAKADIPKIQTQIEALSPWLTLEIPLSFKGTKKTAVFIGSFSDAVTEESITVRLGELAPEADCDVNVIYTSNEISSVVIVCMRKDADAVDNALRHMNFSRPPASDIVPAKLQERYENDIKDCDKKIEEISGMLAGYAEERDDIRFIQDYYTMRADKYEVIGNLEQSDRTFLLSGYVTAAAAPALEQKLTERFDACVEITDPAENDDVPVALSNNAFAAPVEGVIESYSMPGKGEMDPTMPVAVFYYFMFGMMLSDFAYGALMTAATALILKKFKNMEAGLKRSMKMFCYCGIGTMVSGILFGSYFGDAPTVIAKLFFGKDFVIPPLYVDPISNSMKVLVFSFAIGIIHLFAGLILNMYQAIKQGRVVDAISDSLFWMLLVGGLILYGLTTDMVVNMFPGALTRLPGPVGTFGAVCAVVGAAGILIMGGRESRNWGKRLAKGAYALYGVTGYLSDILSYSRLLALGLATSVISTVFNSMGQMVSENLVHSNIFGALIGVILFLVIFLIGHGLNMAINALGAYVHANRLQFVEFFGKFYNGGGRKFQPFAVNTKYFKIKED
ncbi:MAG: V-type ATP synthase subunit I [Lachnospiraceae bacterium]|nr:V-type ATP synthase subunit I [Lachnospiraceae bacterium]